MCHQYERTFIKVTHDFLIESEPVQYSRFKFKDEQIVFDRFSWVLKSG